MASFIIPAIAALAGQFLSHRDKRNQVSDQNELNEEQRRLQDERDRAAQLAQYNMGRPGYERGEAGRAVRGSLSSGVIRKYLSDMGVDPSLLDKISTPTEYPAFEFQPGGPVAPQSPVPGWGGAAGNFLTGVAPYIGLNQSESPFDQYMARRPSTAAAGRGQTYGPPAPISPLFEGSEEDLAGR